MYKVVNSDKEYHVEAVFCPNVKATYGSGPFYFHYQLINTGFFGSKMAILGCFFGSKSNAGVAWSVGQVGTISS